MHRSVFASPWMMPCRAPLRLLGVIGLTALGFRPVDAQTKRPLAIEDFYSVRTVSAPQLSPAGAWVAYVVTSRVEATNAEPGEVWLAASDGRTPPRRVSPPGRDATAPQWDGERLHFRSEGRRWQVDPAHPDALVDLGPPGDARASSATLAAPVGGRSVVLRDAAPPPPPADARTDFERRHDARFQGRQFNWLNSQRDGARYPVPDRTDPRLFPAQELWLASTNGDGSRPLTQLGLRPQGVQWNAQGGALLFWADSGYRDERRYAANAVYVVSIDGTVRMLTTDRDVDHDEASFSPDGKWVLYTRQLSRSAVIARRLDHGGATDLAIRPVGGGPERLLTADWDLLPVGAVWSADSRFVYFNAAVAGAHHLFRVPLAGGPVEQVSSGARRLSGFSFDRRTTRVAYTATTAAAPADVYVARLDAAGHLTDEQRLSDVNAALARQVAFSDAVRLQFPSADGTPIEGFLWTPYGYDATRRYPLVVSNHGGPHSADGYGWDFKTQYLTANGYFVLKVNFRSSTGYGEPFLWGTWGAWGTRDGQDVMAGVDHVLSRWPVDRSRVATIGHSYGGFMTNWLITQYPDRFAAAVPGAGIVNWVSDYGTADIAVTKETEFYGTPWDSTARAIMMRQSPLTYAGRVRTPTLFVHGEIDERVPYSEAEQMFVALKKNGVPAEMLQYKDMPHAISGSWNNVHRLLHERRWLDQWLAPSRVVP